MDSKVVEVDNKVVRNYEKCKRSERERERERAYHHGPAAAVSMIWRLALFLFFID